MSDHRPTKDELGKACGRFLEEICTTTAGILMAQPKRREQIHINIKTLCKFRDSELTRYEVSAYARNPDRRRLSDENQRVEPFQVRENAFHEWILNSTSNEDYCLVRNIDDFLKTSRYREPHPKLAPSYYKSALIVAIIGPKLEDFELPNQRVALPRGSDETVLGFLCADSLEYDAFHADRDLNMLRQSAVDAYEALRLWFSAYKASNYPSIHVVKH
jgi:hypothetical protein